MSKMEEKKCYTYISKTKQVFDNHNFVRETKNSDGICSKCGIVVDGEIVDAVLKHQEEKKIPK